MRQLSSGSQLLRLGFDLHFNTAHWMDYFKPHTTSHSTKELGHDDISRICIVRGN